MPVLAAGALALGLAAQLLLPAARPLTEASPLAPRRPRPIVAPTVGPYPVILQAPIFSPDRKPGEEEETPGAGALGGFVAIAVALGHNFATALMKGPDGAIRTVHLGDSVLDWRLVGIESSKLTFERDTARHEVPIGAPAAVTNQNGSDE
jgi:hypothetical protein